MDSVQDSSSNVDGENLGEAVQFKLHEEHGPAETAKNDADPIDGAHSDDTMTRVREEALAFSVQATTQDGEQVLTFRRRGEVIDISQKPSSTHPVVQDIMDNSLEIIKPDLLSEGFTKNHNALRLALYAAAVQADRRLRERVYVTLRLFVILVSDWLLYLSKISSTCFDITNTMLSVLAYFLENDLTECESLTEEVKNYITELEPPRDLRTQTTKVFTEVDSLRKYVHKGHNESETISTCLEGLQKMEAYIRRLDQFWSALADNYGKSTKGRDGFVSSYRQANVSKAAKERLYFVICRFVALGGLCQKNCLGLKELRNRFDQQLVEHPEKDMAALALPLLRANPNYNLDDKEKERLRNLARNAQERRAADMRDGISGCILM